MVRSLFAFLIFFTIHAHAVRPDLKRLPIGLAPSERGWKGPTDQQLQSRGALPPGPVHSLGEWEDADAVMTLWNNPSYVKALAANGPVRLIADTESDVGWWKSWLSSNAIPQNGFDYLVTPTDTIWVRDYGPWWILDGAGQMGIVDNIYNRPRPQDDRFPIFMAAKLGIPRYEPGLVHTGGNYYSDGAGNAFSSTLVFSENRKLSPQEVLKRMFDFLGINRYTTTPLGTGVTIEHMDTFGKLLAPDTYLVAQWPLSTSFHQDTEKLVEILKSLPSPYGTPYKIFRIGMTPRGRGDFRAYINSFISNRVLYFPTYGGDAADLEAARIYQAALPGYKIVGVDNGNTGWGDSVHCRSRNLIKMKNIFIFPHVYPQSAASAQTVVDATVVPSPGAKLASPPKIVWSVDEKLQAPLAMVPVGFNDFRMALPKLRSGAKVEFYIEARDTAGLLKAAPINAPYQSIEFVTE